MTINALFNSISPLFILSNFNSRTQKKINEKEGELKHMSQVETLNFETESKQILDLMIHSVYSNKDVFLRELVSNASDALDKLNFESITDKNISDLNKDLHIEIIKDKENRTLMIRDNGIGMNHDELVQNIGTIAKSGTKEFVKKIKESKDQSLSSELIGQFGIGFYSAFMVADKVIIETRKAGQEKSYRWTNADEGKYTIEEIEKEAHGTDIILHLKPVDEEDALKDYLDDWQIKSIIKKYSDFVSYPIRMMVPDLDKEGKEVGLKEEVLNSMKAIWHRSAGEVKDEEYHEFYKHITHDWTEPLKVIPYKAEGTMEYSALLFIPSKAPMDLYYRDYQPGIQLYVRNVFILDQCKDILPDYLRFVKGVVDSNDLSLNVSREILQQDRQIQLIRKTLTKKVLDVLKQLKNKDLKEYLKFWHEFGRTLKEGVSFDFENKDKIQDLLLFQSSLTSDDEYISLPDYVERMKTDQEAIYFITGESRKKVENSPHLEAFKDKGYEVLYLTDPIDEMIVSSMFEYKGKKLKSVGKGEVELGSEEERKEAEEKRKEKEKTFKSLFDAVRKHLQEEVKEIRISNRLKSSAVCLVSSDEDMSPQMEQIMKQMNQEVKKQKRIMELNPDHPILEKMQTIFEKNKKDPILKDYSELLFGQALLAEGGQLPEPVKFSKLIADLMIKV